MASMTATALKDFYPTRADAKQIAHHMSTYLQTEKNMEVQIIGDETSSMVVQARINFGGLKKFFGLDRAATLRIIKASNGVFVEVGEAKWIDKAVVGGIAFFVTLGFLIIPTIWGSVQQKKLFSDIKTELKRYTCQYV